MKYRRITWEEVYKAISLRPAGKLYGIPRGGAIIAGLSRHAVEDPADADIIVDDIVDSGATKEHWIKRTGKPFWAAFTRKPGEPFYVFPWEGEGDQDLDDLLLRVLQHHSLSGDRLNHFKGYVEFYFEERRA